VLLGLVGLVVVAVWAAIGFTRETADDRRELPRQVEFRIDGALIQGWTLTRPTSLTSGRPRRAP
jgi:hypothetical protein